MESTALKTSVNFSCYRNEGGQERLNDKGLVTYDRQIKKDAFYFYKANWNKEDKFVYITAILSFLICQALEAIEASREY